MRHYIIVALVGLCACSPLCSPILTAQEVHHAPTVEQCRADQRLWLSELNNETSVASIGFHTLLVWAVEMGDCQSVDPQHVNQYLDTDAVVAFRQTVRLERFIKRHNLYDQFIAEDAQGKGR